jgi:preprotein translocase subunit YajC
MLLPIILLLYLVIVFLPGKRRQEKERQEALVKNLKKNDKVLTIAGIYGTVVNVSDTENEITVRVDDNTRLRMTKDCIARNFTREEEAKAEKDAKEKK